MTRRVALTLTLALGAGATPLAAQQGTDADGWQAVGAAPSGSAAEVVDGAATAPPPGEGWQAVGAAPSLGGARPGERPGDRLWVARDGDTLADVARAATGSVDGAGRIGAYNALGDGAVLAPGQLLYIPADLAPPPRTAPAEPEIREFGENEGGAGAPRGDAPEVMRSDADLFVGEVRVFGRVDVSRVAIGNGAIVRAEVLDSGELLVIAQSPGSTSLRLWNKDGTQADFNIRVSESDPETRVRMERMVRMRVRLVEFKRSALGRLGIRWSDSASGPTLGIAGDAIGNDLFRPGGDGAIEGLPNTVRPFSTYFGVASEITSRINLLASNGDAITLAEPVLSTTNGGSASFLAGGEVPYPSTGA